MAGQLVQVATETVTSAVASVTLTGIDSDDVYMVAYNNLAPDVDNRYAGMRFTESGTPNSTANYDRAMKTLFADSAFPNGSNTNETQMYASTQFMGTGTGESLNGILYIYNANNSSEYTFATTEVTHFMDAAHLRGQQGGFVFTVASAVNGINFFTNADNFASGTFTLYKVI